MITFLTPPPPAEHYREVTTGRTVRTAKKREAAARAGYIGSRPTLAVTGHEILRNPKIRAELTTPLLRSCHARDRRDRARYACYARYACNGVWNYLAGDRRRAE